MGAGRGRSRRAASIIPKRARKEVVVQELSGPSVPVYSLHGDVDGNSVNWFRKGIPANRKLSVEELLAGLQKWNERIREEGTQSFGVTLRETRVVNGEEITRDVGSYSTRVEGLHEKEFEPMVALLRAGERLGASGSSNYALEPALGVSLHLEVMENGKLEVALRRRFLNDELEIVDVLDQRDVFDPVYDRVAAAEHAADIEAQLRALAAEGEDEDLSSVAYQGLVRDNAQEARALRQHLLAALEDFPTPSVVQG